MRNEFEVAFSEIAELRALPPEVVLEALQTALVSAYRRDSGASAAQSVEAEIDANTGRSRIFVEKEVVEEVKNPHTEVDLENARFYDPECDLNDTVMVQVTVSTKKFGRIAAQTAKQVILQKIREAERDSLYDEFIEREGDLITGTVQSVNQSVVTISLGRAEAIMPRKEQIRGEFYRPHDKLRTCVLEVKRGNRGPQIIVSRSHRHMLRRLLEYEVPEIFNGQVEIKNIAREAGYRSKVAVVALQDGIDPVGACVGMRGVRIQNIVKELHDEKIDVIEWNPNQEAFISKSLSPARVTGVYLDDDPNTGRTAVVVVPDDQLSLAIGREGQNARLAAKLTGWRIDIKSVTESVQSALDNLDEPPMSDLKTSHADLVEEVQHIMLKKAENRTVMPEEYNSLGKLADVVERRSLAAREEIRQAHLEEIAAVKATLPPTAFQLPVGALDLPEELVEALSPLENVGEIMLRFLIDEGRIHRLLSKFPDDALSQLQNALDTLVIPEHIEVAIEQIVEAEEVSDAVAEEGEAEAVAEEGEAEAAESEEAEATVAGELETEPELKTEAPPGPEFVDEFFDDDDPLQDQPKSTQKKKKERQRRRQLVLDEESGQVIAKRRRKGSRKRDEWDVEEY